MKKKLIWLECCGCSGNIISLLDSTAPSFEILLKDYVNLVYNNSHMAAYGNEAMDLLFNTIEEGGYILCVEGAISTADDGRYNIIGYHRGKPITGLQAVKLAAGKADHVIAVGNCASYGGPSATPPNPSGSKSVYDIVGNKVIRMPCSPCEGEWIASLLTHLVSGKSVELDTSNRPLYLYGFTIHDKCERRILFEKKIFARNPGDQGCMFNLGCKGPTTKAPCPVTRWNDYINWPVACNTPCIGCGEPDFPIEPFFKQRGVQNE